MFRHREKNKEARGAAVRRIRGTVELGAGYFRGSLLDAVHKILLGRSAVSFSLVSATASDPGCGGRGKVGKAARVEVEEADGKTTAVVNFEWDESQGIPGAVLVRNMKRSEFFLKTLTLEDVPGKGTVVFIANSWIFPLRFYSQDRIFFTNDAYLPSNMPTPLVPYRLDELKILRGDDNHRPYKNHDRIYRYDYYNDLGEPDKGEGYARPILGGKLHPYPRRCRTGRKPANTDPNSESRRFFLNDIYVPCDERSKMTLFAGSYYSLLKSFSSLMIRTLVWKQKEFDSFEDILELYGHGPQAPNNPLIADIRKKVPSEFLRSINHPLTIPFPNIIKSDMLKKAPECKFAWRTDMEFARETLAGMNPVIIKRLTEFPAKSSLDPLQYGDHTSRITEAHIQHNLDGLTVQNALRNNRLFIIDHHDNFMPYLNQINKLNGNYIVYASRTLLLLKDDGTLKPLAIELSLPHANGQQHGADSRVYIPPDHTDTGAEGHIWQLAKAYACVNDSAWHQLISHWLNTHAVIEPFAIATNRQLSVVHPVHKLLKPHYRNTMNCNALARLVFINAGGMFEVTLFTGKYSLDFSSHVYKNWNFTEQALPDDLVKRGVAVPDESSPYGVRLLIEDYPYAVDGLAIWSAIEQWVKEYLDIYYPDDGELQRDEELREWWQEVREEAHGDLKDRDWWPKLDTVQELARTCTTIIWVASALHAAVNFGQYSYAGYPPNRPTMSRLPMPEPGSREYEMLEEGQEEADKVFLRTFTRESQIATYLPFVEMLSKHAPEEVYLGQRDEPERWTSDARALEAFQRFGSELKKIEGRIMELNSNPALKNRTGPVELPYMLLYPNTSDVGGKRAQGLTAMGIPNSISI